MSFKDDKTIKFKGVYFMWKVDLTHIMFNSDKALVGVEKQDGS